MFGWNIITVFHLVVRDKGTPAALDEDTITGRAFLALAENVVKQTELRNAGQEATKIVELKK